jgi:hypothetical protein
MPRAPNCKATASTPKKRVLSDEAIEKALLTCGGWHSLTAAKLGYSRGYITDRINSSEHLKKIQYEIAEERTDRYEKALDNHAFNEANLTAVIFYLKTLGRKRGYSENQETDQLTETARELVNEIKSLKVENLPQEKGDI